MLGSPPTGLWKRPDVVLLMYLVPQVPVDLRFCVGSDLRDVRPAPWLAHPSAELPFRESRPTEETI